MPYSQTIYCSGYLKTLNLSSNTFNEIKNKNAPLFSDKQRNDLFAAVLIHDDCYPEAVLPETIHLDYSKEQLQQCFLICKQIWQQGVDREELINIIIKISRQHRLSEEEQRNYKYIRAKFKHLRFAFVTCDKKHRYPKIFHLVTSVMGYFQDAFKNNQKTNLSRSTWLLRLLLSKFCYGFIIKEINGFKASEATIFKQYIQDQIQFLKIHLTKPAVTSKQFHEMRKVISRQVALYDNLKILFPSDYHKNISEYLSTINGLMGSLHDTLIAKKFEKSHGYYADTFEIPEDIKQRLLTFTNKYQF